MQYECVTVFSSTAIKSTLITTQLDKLQSIKELPTKSQW